jgi:hypothetical protein
MLREGPVCQEDPGFLDLGFAPCGRVRVIHPESAAR